MIAITPRSGLLLLCAGSAFLLAGVAADDGPAPAVAPRWKQHDVRRPRPPAVEPAEGGVIASKPPKDAVVLFDGSNLDAWQGPDGGPARWQMVDGRMETLPGAGPIRTKGQFGDIQLHLEWASPSPPRGSGQDRGNSGVFLMGQFEIQVLDSYKAATYADGQAGAIYGQYPPLSNASRPPGQWQSYDIAFRRPRFDARGKLQEPARITLFHNGLLVQDNEAPVGPTSWLKNFAYEDRGGRGPIMLQDHDHPVRYRNIWLRELPERPAPSPIEAAPPQAVVVSQDVLDRCSGRYRMGEGPRAPVVTIARVGGNLAVTFPFRPGGLELVPVSETTFEMPSTDGRFTFQADPQGQITGALFRIGDGERLLKRVEP